MLNIIQKYFHAMFITFSTQKHVQDKTFFGTVNASDNSKHYMSTFIFHQLFLSEKMS
jgi:hypothetical protein